MPTFEVLSKSEAELKTATGKAGGTNKRISRIYPGT